MPSALLLPGVSEVLLNDTTPILKFKLKKHTEQIINTMSLLVCGVVMEVAVVVVLTAMEVVSSVGVSGGVGRSGSGGSSHRL